jgi:hypothetical protein
MIKLNARLLATQLQWLIDGERAFTNMPSWLKKKLNIVLQVNLE